MIKKFIPAYFLTFVNVLGFSILMPILPFIVDRYGAPKWDYGLLITCYAAFQFIGAPFLGALSDRKGRKQILLISQAGTLLSWFLFLFALFLPDMWVYGISIPLIVIAFSRLLDGVTGGNTSVTNAYVSDITTRKEKSYIFGYLGGISGLGMIVGPGLGGFAASTSLGYIGTLLVSILISILALLTIFFWLKESHPIEKRTTDKSASIIDNFLILKRIRLINPKPVIKLLFTIKFIFSIMMACYIASMALFLIDTFHFNESQLGMFLFVVGAFLSFNQAFVSKKIIGKIGEFSTLIVGLLLSFFGLFSITLTTNLWLFISFYYVMNLGLSLVFPTLSALIAIHANPQKQGEIMGVSESLNSFALAAFPIVATALYSIMGSSFYYVVSVLPLLALTLAYFGIKKLGKNLD